MKHVLAVTVVLLLLLILLVYGTDYLILRYRVSKNRNPYGSVTDRDYYAIPRKDGRAEFVFADPETEICVHSLFPHFGDRPCWYASRRSSRRIDE